MSNTFVVLPLSIYRKLFKHVAECQVCVRKTECGTLKGCKYKRDPRIINFVYQGRVSMKTLETRIQKQLKKPH